MSDHFDCPICQDVFEQVLETPCCHTCYCKACITDWLEKSPSCPHCRASISSQDCKPNYFCQRLVDSLAVSCPFFENGCIANITRGIVKDHANRCEFAVVQCSWNPGVCQPMLRKDLPVHSNLCDYRNMLCSQGCGATVAFKEISDHLQICPNAEVLCDCGVNVQKCNLPKHCKTECPLSLVECSYRGLGCQTMVQRRHLDTHCTEAALQHVSILNEAIDAKETEKIRVENKLAAMSEQYCNLQRFVEELKRLRPNLSNQPLHEMYPILLPSAIQDNPDQSVYIGASRLQAQYMLRSGIFSRVAQETPAVLIRANCSIPEIVKKGFVYYFEINVRNAGRGGIIGIGLSEYKENVSVMPGWVNGTFGYHGDDGRVFGTGCNNHGKAYGKSYGSGTTVGCGYDLWDRSIFFTLNGKSLGIAFTDVRFNGAAFPVCGLRSYFADVIFNFGQRPFVYDITSHVNHALTSAYAPGEGESSSLAGRSMSP